MEEILILVSETRDNALFYVSALLIAAWVTRLLDPDPVLPRLGSR